VAARAVALMAQCEAFAARLSMAEQDSARLGTVVAARGAEEAAEGARARARLAALEEALAAKEVYPPPSRTNWTRLVPSPVLTGHVSSLPPY
jgi:hypothetical protein